MIDTNKNQQIIEILQTDLLKWFEKAKRDLPFRHTKDPYFIWISEIMAQQTQIDTLIPFYNRFIDNFPTIFSLALASADEVIKAWEGLGYYSRARNLHQAARLIVSDYDGMMPDSFAELIKLPGIGPYTGGAIASIAFNEKVSAVDGNVLRVISRYCNSFDDISDAKTKKRMTHWIESLLPEAAGDFNEALMELGAIVCTPQSPKCLICPIRSGCQSTAAGTTGQVPVKKKKSKQLTKKMEVGIVTQNGRLFFVRRPNSGLLSGMWSFPIAETAIGNGQDIKKKLGENFPELNKPVFIGTSRHVFSHIIWEMSVYGFNLDGIVCETASHPYLVSNQQESQSDRQTAFKALSQIDDLALPVAFSKLLALLKTN
ncbi:A/G-specific adenine glycosylase [Acetobacterium sp.]|jgi:A/G-specific adenine glycosylase|uniref:A/G-specific adenine glycosylase n=1 Tax=Acetobacterium sp. TaxID=1872094 RepID=UPI000CB90819|nr:A/G-specific adenine glycosylase [Acetobacterium sp.]MDO9492475.1 A/G-specific adenine glycosylase [Acetobacterium sp.]PKM73055.1 MAG: A/G-specific adenine glycosylase [Firmicutes bacterium HGW-Firmicutes-17]